MSEPTRTSVPEFDGRTRTAAPGAGASEAGHGIEAPAGYELLDEIGSGGMGVVFRARHIALARDVAVKALHARYGPGSLTAARFVDEARITAQLQHPGIPAVHELGTLSDGRPFLAMKLVRGRTLDELLKESPDLAHDRERFVPVFEQVCQAVAFAHAHGVIHRDLKPANVMVGAFGETQVMDWGIAKEMRAVVRSARPADPEATADINATPNSDRTQAGSILGTPAYMPPEQAIGAVDLVDERSDVFGLGAILCVILTGKPPYGGESVESTRQQAARAKLDDAFARLGVCGAEPELVALAKRCMAAEPAERPGNAGEVAEAVAALRADAERRARQAEMDRARAEVQAAEERKRRRVKLALAGSLVGLLAVAGAAAWWVDSLRAQRRAEQAAEQLRQVEIANARAIELKEQRSAHERSVADAITDALVLIDLGREQQDDLGRWRSAISNASFALQRAKKALDAGEPTKELRDRFYTVGMKWAEDDRAWNLLFELDRIADGNEVQLFISLGMGGKPAEQFAAAFRKYGVDVLNAPHAEAVAWLRGHRFRDRLVTAIRNWRFSLPFAGFNVPGAVPDNSSDGFAAVTGEFAVAVHGLQPSEQTKLDKLLDALTENPFVREWWAAVGRKDAAALKAMLARPEMGRLSSRELSSLADGLSPFSGVFEVARPFLEAAYARFPGDFWVNFRLAAVHALEGGESEAKRVAQSAEAVRHLTAAVAARPGSAMARALLGMALFERWKDDPTRKNDLAARAALGTALYQVWKDDPVRKRDLVRTLDPAAMNLLRGAVELDPTSPWPHFFLAMIWQEQENWSEAFAAFRRCVTAEPEFGFLMVHTIFLGIGGRDPDTGATPPDADFTRFIDDLIAANPSHPGGYDLRGEHLLKAGNGRGALAAFRKARDLTGRSYPRWPLLEAHLDTLEPLAKWEAKFPAVVRGEVRVTQPAEVRELAAYCATFENKYALATRVVVEGSKAEPRVLDGFSDVVRFAGWAVQAGEGRGTDAASLTAEQRAEHRRVALVWLRDKHRDLKTRTDRLAVILQQETILSRDLRPVRDPHALAKLPAGERAEWEKLWAELDTGLTPVAPPGEEKR